MSCDTREINTDTWIQPMRRMVDLATRPRTPRRQGLAIERTASQRGDVWCSTGSPLTRKLSITFRAQDIGIGSMLGRASIDAAESSFNGLSWTIFSDDDVVRMIEVARIYGLHPVESSHEEVGERAVHCAGKDYAFGWIAFRKVVAE